jgi:hypothetical protein
MSFSSLGAHIVVVGAVWCGVPEHRSGGNPVTVIVGVHGIAQQQLGRNQLVAAWGPALRDGIELSARRAIADPPLDLAFYGDVSCARRPMTGRDRRPPASRIEYSTTSAGRKPKPCAGSPRN